MHPQLETKKSPKSPMGFIKGHRRSTSHHNISREISLKEIIKPIEIQPSHSSNDLCSMNNVDELDDRVYDLFKAWRLKPSLLPSCPLLSLFMREDILPTLHFLNQEVGAAAVQYSLYIIVTLDEFTDKIVTRYQGI